MTDDRRGGGHSRKVRTSLLAVLLVGVVLGCGDPIDERERVRQRRGEPDDITQGGAGPYWYELWYYQDDSTYYEFHRGAPKCGGGHDYYLYRTYYGIPPGKGIPAHGDTIEFPPPPEQGRPLGP